MVIEDFDTTVEKQILTGMILDDVVCGHVADKWNDGGLFSVRWSNLVGAWCVDYFAKYSKAPGADIEGLFTAWADTATDTNIVDLVDSFLSDLSDEYEAEGDQNSAYLIDVAGQHFNAVALERVADLVKGCIKSGDIDRAVEAVVRWDHVDLGVGAGIDVLHDRDAVQEAFEADAEPLIRYPGALGKFFGNQLARDEFVGLIGATGRGKTWWLLDIAWTAIRQGRRVAFFEVGDMSQNQIMRRFMCRASGHPLRRPFEIEVPTRIWRGDGEDVVAQVETDTRIFKRPLNWRSAWDACERKTRRHKKPLLKLSVHPNDSINVAGISSVLNVWERQGWVPDVVVIDYADILARPVGCTEERDAINTTWKALRSMSQERHILVVTATQGDARSYDASVISRGNFSDDRRKNDHVTGMLGINASDAERDIGVYRLNWVKRREAQYSESACVHVAGCLSIGRPHTCSTF